MVKKTIMVVDDKAGVRQLVREYLAEEGYRVVTAENGRQALFVARHEKPDLILLDLMMPEMGGYEFMRLHARESDTPIIVLTAKVEESDKVLGLELGADDYVTKPFSMRELVARIRAVLRRLEKARPSAQVLRSGGISLDRGTRQVTVGKQAASLTPTEFDLLAVFLAAPGRVFSRSDLLIELQGVAFEGIERTVDVHIRNLRRKIEPDPANPRYIETVFGVGYRLATKPPQSGPEQSALG
jgi:DNA-binding response OmpR family regulator